MKKTQPAKTTAPAPAAFEIPAGYALRSTVEYAGAVLVLTVRPVADTGGWRIDLDYTPAPALAAGQAEA